MGVARMMGNDTGRSEGAVREAGGAFGKKEKAQEDQFFRQQQQEQLKKLKNAHNDEIKAHESKMSSISALVILSPQVLRACSNILESILPSQSYALKACTIKSSESFPSPAILSWKSLTMLS